MVKISCFSWDILSKKDLKPYIMSYALQLFYRMEIFTGRPFARFASL